MKKVLKVLKVYKVLRENNPFDTFYTLYTSYTFKKGFTLIELLVAITILAIIATIGLTLYSSAQMTGRDSKRKSDLQALSTALELYYQSQSTPASYPGALSALSPNFINQIPTDPTNNSPHIYAYASSGSCGTGACSFELCAALENKSAPIGNGIDSNQGACSGGATRYFHIYNP